MINPLPARRFYTMDEDGDIFEATDIDTWGEWMEMTDRSIKRTLLPEGCTISTAFTGRNKQWDMNQPPILFETMVFDGPLHNYSEGYETRAEAERGHDLVVEMVQTTIDVLRQAGEIFISTAK